MGEWAEVLDRLLKEVQAGPNPFSDLHFAIWLMDPKQAGQAKKDNKQRQLPLVLGIADVGAQRAPSWRAESRTCPCNSSRNKNYHHVLAVFRPNFREPTWTHSVLTVDSTFGKMSRFPDSPKPRVAAFRGSNYLDLKSLPLHSGVCGTMKT